MLILALASYAPLAAATATVIAALGGLLKIVLDSQDRSERRHIDAAAALVAQQALIAEKLEARQEKFLGNHMSTNTRALEHVADRLENVEDVVRDVRAAVGWRRPDNGSH